MKTIVRVSEMWKQSDSQNKPLLSDLDKSFWQVYKADYKTYDRLFKSIYASFKYFCDGEKQTVSTCTEEFTLDVKSILTANAKKYEELFRMENLDDSVYNILDNYDLTEILNRKNGNTRNENIGERNDSAEYGEQHNDTNTSTPSISTTRENTISAFDSDDYQPREKSTEKVDAYAIDVNEQIDAHTDKTTIGNQTNIITDEGNENYTLTRKGNIGVMTQSDVLLKHLELWDSYTYYQKIFADIANLLLYA